MFVSIVTSDRWSAADAALQLFVIFDLNRKATLLILGPALVWGIAYFIIAIEFGLTVLLISLFALVFIVLGYFGIAVKVKIPSQL